MAIYLGREIPKRFKLIGREEILLRDQIGIKVSEGMHPGLSSIYMRPSQVDVGSPLETKTRKN